MITDRVIPEELKDKIKILVLEDNPLNQKVVGHMLKNWGFKYDIFPNGKGVLEGLSLDAYDLVLLDIQMPEYNGYQTAEYIRKKLKLELPIIAMTAHAMPGEKEKCLNYGMTDYISKPLDEIQLCNLITNYLFSSVVETEQI